MTPSIDATEGVEPACPRGGAASAPRPPLRRLTVMQRPFDSLDRATWDRLAEATTWATPFALWPFHRAWWDAYGASAHDQTLVVFDPAQPLHDGGSVASPIAIVPLMHRHEVEPEDAAAATRMRHGSEEVLTPVSPTAKAVFFGASYHADYATVLAADGDLPSVAEAVATYLAGLPDPGDAHPEPWDVVDLRRLRCGDPAADDLAAALLRQEAARGWIVNVEREDVCPVATIPAGVDLQGFLGSLGKKERHEIRRKLRRAEALGAVRLVESVDPLADLELFIDLHQRRWGADGLFPPTVGGAASRVFFRRLFELFGPGGPLRLAFLDVGERRIAAGVYLEDATRLYYYNAGVDPDARELSPGVLLVAACVERAIATGKVAVDFLRGDEPYKYEWGSVDEPIQRILVRRAGEGGVVDGRAATARRVAAAGSGELT